MMYITQLPYDDERSETLGYLLPHCLQSMCKNNSDDGIPTCVDGVLAVDLDLGASGSVTPSLSIQSPVVKSA